MTMARASRSGGRLIPKTRKSNSYSGAAGRASGRQVRPGKALVWLFGLGFGVVFVGVLSLGLLVGFRWVTTSSFFALHEIAVQGTVRLSVDDIVALAGVEIGENTLDIKIADVEQRIAASPWAEQVAVRRVLPGTLQISVKERVPAYWVRTGNGLFYAEADGSVIAEVQPKGLSPLTVLEVESGAGRILPKLPAMMARLDQLGLPARSADAAWVRVLPERVEFFFEDVGLTLSASVTDWEPGMQRLGAVWKDLERRGEARRVAGIRIFSGKVWVTT